MAHHARRGLDSADQIIHWYLEKPETWNAALQVEELANPALKMRHWEEIFQLIGAEVESNENGTGGLGVGGWVVGSMCVCMGS